MIRFLSMRRIALTCFVSALCALGCGSKGVMAPVRGKVTVDGQPVTSGQVSLIPLSDAKGTGASGPSSGNIENGSYTIKTGTKDGAPLGKYKVTVTRSMMPSSDGKPATTTYDKKYSNAKETPIEIEVVASPKPDQYDLKLTKE